MVGHHRLPRGERAGRKGSLLRARNIVWLRARQAVAVASYLAAGLLVPQVYMTHGLRTIWTDGVRGRGAIASARRGE